MSLSSEKNDILVLFNLENEDVQDVTFTNEPTFAAAHIFLRASYEPCPDCGNTNVVVKGYEIKKINHGVLTDRKLILFYHARRYRCPVCGRTYHD